MHLNTKRSLTHAFMLRPPKKHKTSYGDYLLVLLFEGEKPTGNQPKKTYQTPQLSTGSDSVASLQINDRRTRGSVVRVENTTHAGRGVVRGMMA